MSYAIYDTVTGTTFLKSFKTEAAAKAYIREWAVKASRTDLVVVEV